MIGRALRVGVAAALAGALALALARAPTASAGWRHFVLDNPSGFSYPRSVRVLSGPVRAPRGLLRPGGSEIKLRRGARLVIDMGEEVGGRVEARVTRARGQIRLSYSEARTQLRRGGDMGFAHSLGPGQRKYARTDVITRRGGIHAEIQAAIRCNRDDPGIIVISCGHGYCVAGDRHLHADALSHRRSLRECGRQSVCSNS